jgi:hypothetical protein
MTVYVKSQIMFEGCPIPVENRIKILGLTMDSPHTMTPQEKIAALKGCDGHCIINAVPLGPSTLHLSRVYLSLNPECIPS